VYQDCTRGVPVPGVFQRCASTRSVPGVCHYQGCSRGVPVPGCFKGVPVLRVFQGWRGHESTQESMRQGSMGQGG